MKTKKCKTFLKGNGAKIVEDREIDTMRVM